MKITINMICSLVITTLLFYCFVIQKENFEIDHIPQNLKVIHTTLNKIIRAIFRLPKYNKQNDTYTSTTPLYKKLGVLKVHTLYYYHLILLCHEYFYNEKFPEKIGAKFIRRENVTNKSTRAHNLDLYYNVPRLTNTYKKPTLAGTKLWNLLPQEIRNIKGKKKFKTILKQYLIENYQ